MSVNAPNGHADRQGCRREKLARLVAVISVGIFFCGALQIGNPSELDAASPKVGIVIRDSDDLVGAGTDVEIEIWVRDADSGKSYTLRFLDAFGGAFVLERDSLAGAEFDGPRNDDGDLGPLVARLVIPPGHAPRSGDHLGHG